MNCIYRLQRNEQVIGVVQAHHWFPISKRPQHCRYVHPMYMNFYVVATWAELSNGQDVRCDAKKTWALCEDLIDAQNLFAKREKRAREEFRGGTYVRYGISQRVRRPHEKSRIVTQNAAALFDTI